MALRRIGYVLLHPATFLITSTLGLIIAGGMLWREHRGGLGVTADLLLTAGQIGLNRPEGTDPALVDQVRQQLEALRQPLEDPDAVNAIARALLQVGPIERVRSVAKSRNGVQVEGVWREPVATVRVAEGMYRLVDGNGVTLDRVVGEADSTAWLRISLPSPGGESLRPWQLWNDHRVVAAAGIARQVKDHAEELGLVMVVTFRPPDGLGPSSGSYELWTANHAKVIWSDEGARADPALVARRIDALHRWVKTNGPLDQLAGRMILDLRMGSVSLIADRVSVRLPDEPVEVK